MHTKLLGKIVTLGLTVSLSISSTAYANTLGKVTANTLNIRSGPSTSYSIIDRTYYGNTVSIISKENNWYKIDYNNTFSYVHSDYINEQEDTSTGSVTATLLNFRSSPEISNNIIGQLKNSEKVTILNTLDKWYYVTNQNGTYGYVYKTYISTSQNTNSDLREAIVTYAKQFLGNPYVYGGTSLTNGIDCSAFVQQIYGAFGYSLHRTSRTQINDGVRISSDELLPGDLVFYGYNNVISHVAMYIGNGDIIHASSPSTGIKISGIFSDGRKPYIGSVRIINN
jgi:cell wall-associated NlpC family hydrolase